MRAVLEKEHAYHYVSEGSMVEFINLNSEMEWNYICDFIRDNNIAGEEGMTFWEKTDLDPTRYNPEAVKWVGAFFEAHPWIERMMIVFDD
jgi:hypothetical protein